MVSVQTRRLLQVAAVVLALGALVAFPDTAMAQYDGDEDLGYESAGKENAYQVVGRFRTVGIPNFVLDAFYDRHSANWRNGHTNFAYGAEFVWRKIGAFELSVAGEYADLSMPRGWWKESDKARTSADYVEMNLSLVSLVFSGYYYWDVAEWFSPYVGGGAGLAMVLGDVVKYSPRKRGDTACRDSLASGASGSPGDFGGEACYDEQGDVDYQNEQKFQREIEEDVWPVAPVVNLTGGARFNIQENGVIKLEVGFYNYLFAGISAGVQW